MSLDPNIILQGGVGVTRLNSPLDTAIKGNQYRQGIQSYQENQNSLAAQAQKQADDAEIKNAWVSSGGDLDKFFETGSKSLNPTVAMAVAKNRDAHYASLAALAKSKQEMSEEERKAAKEKAEDAAKMYAWVQSVSPEQRQQALDYGSQTLGVPPSEYDPVKADIIGASLAMHAKALDPNTAWDRSFKEKEFSNTIRHQTEMEKTARIQANKPGFGMPTPSSNPNATAGSAEERLAGVPQNVQALVKGVGTYRILTSQLSPRQKNEIMGYVAQVFPNYSVSDADSNHKFIVDLASGSANAAGGIVGASERLLGHIGEASDLTEKLGNSSFGKLGNTVGQWASTTTGTGNAGDVKAFNLTKGKVIAELNKLANGGVPEAKQMADDVLTLQASDPPEVKYKVLKAAAQLGLEQTHAVEAKRNNIMGEYSPKNSLLSPRAQSVVKRVWAKSGSSAPDLAQPTTGTGYTNTAIANNPGNATPGSALPKIVTLADVQETAKSSGKSVEEVKMLFKKQGTEVK